MSFLSLWVSGSPLITETSSAATDLYILRTWGLMHLLSSLPACEVRILFCLLRLDSCFLLTGSLALAGWLTCTSCVEQAGLKLTEIHYFCFPNARELHSFAAYI